jgi:Family of unknown function (DUF6345)/HYR domain
MQAAIMASCLFLFTAMAGAQTTAPLNLRCPTNVTLWTCSDVAVWTTPLPVPSGGCSNYNVVCQPPVGTALPIGATTVMCRVFDACQNSDTCTFTITVRRDTEPPVIKCPSNIVERVCPTAAGACGGIINYPTPTATDNSGVVSAIVCNPPSGSFFPCGVNVVTCRVFDRCQNQDTCEFTITVEPGGQPPSIQCPPDQTVLTCSNSAVVTYPFPVVLPSGTSVICLPPSGTVMTLGSHAVTCIASNSCGTAQCSFKVDVRSIPPPVITCPPDVTITLPCLSNCIQVAYAPPTVVNGTLAGCSPPPGACLTPGITTVTCIATNRCGDRDLCRFDVRVIQGQGEPPQILCPTNLTFTTCSNCTVVNYALPVVNNGELVRCNPPRGTCFPLGVTAVVCEASNACARSECTFTITVRPVPPPSILCPTNDVIFTAPCNSNCVPVTYGLPPVLGGGIAVCTPPQGTCLPIGIHAIVCVATNMCGDRDVCQFLVRVVPGQGPPPEIICPNDITVTTCSNCVAVNYPLPTVSNGVLIGCTPPPTFCFPLGATIVSCGASNACARSECKFTVTVRPVPPPTIQCPSNVVVTVPCGSNCVPVVYPLPTVSNGTLIGCNPPQGTCLPVGNYVVICRATNTCGAVAACEFPVHVIQGQGQPPRILCPTNPIVVTNVCGAACVPVNYPLPPVVGGVLVGCNPPPGTCLPVGIHTVTCVATNPCDRDVCTFDVRVVQGQIQPPIIRCPQDITVVACSNDCAIVLYPAPVIINGALVKCDPPSGTCFPIGTTIVNCEASNACARAECKFTVSVLPDSRPTLSIKREGRYVIICWPKTCACYKLQSTLSLSRPLVWVDVPGTPDDHGDSWCVRLPIEPRHRFFRLIKCDQPTAPVFSVTGAGITREQAGRLAGALNIPLDQLHEDEGGGLLFIDPLKFQAIPMKPIQDPALIEELRRGSETDGNSELEFKGIDFEGLRQLQVLDDAKALDVWEHALREAGIEPGTGEHVARHTMFEAVDPSGRPMMEDTMLDTHVLFQFDLGGLQLIGPGANLRVAFGPGGAPTALQAAFRQLKQEGETPILSLDEAARRCAGRYPNLKGNIRPQLAYYAPSMLLPAVQKVLPCFVCGGDASVDGQQVSLLQSIIPASDDPALTPSVLLEASAQGSLVKARATVTGGTPPYTYQWSSSSADLSGLPPGASSIEYEAAPRAEDSSETVKVVVTDANGIQVQASQNVEVTGGAGALLFTAAVGGVSDYGTERGVSDLCAGQQSAFNARFALDGYTRRFNWAASTAWERDFKQGGTGLDHLYVDNADITFYMGHGSGQGFTFENNHDDTLLRYSDAVGAWGNIDQEWMALLSCSVIADSYGGLNWAQRWGPTFDGLHLLLGFSNTAYDEDGFGNAFAQWMLGYRIGPVTLPPMPIRSAWFLAKDGNQPSSVIACTMGVIGPSGLSGYDDYFWGKGPVGPDVRGANIHGYWRVSHP